MTDSEQIKQSMPIGGSRPVKIWVSWSRTHGEQISPGDWGPKVQKRWWGSWGRAEPPPQTHFGRIYSPENASVDTIIFLHKNSNSPPQNGHKTSFLRWNICSSLYVVSISLASAMLELLRLCSLCDHLGTGHSGASWSWQHF